MSNPIIFSFSIMLTPVYLSIRLTLFRWETAFSLGYFPSRDYGYPIRFGYHFWIIFRPDWKHINWVANAYGFDLMVWNDVSHGLIKKK